MAPSLIPKKLGRNAIVSATLNYIRPSNHWREVYPNNYCQVRLRFRVDGIDRDPSGKNVLILSHSDYPGKVFTAFVRSVKLETAGPPNQLFSNDGVVGEQRVVRSPIPRAEPVEEEEDFEPVEDGVNADDGEEGTLDVLADMTAADDNNPTTDGEWTWTAFTESIINDSRGANPKNDPAMKQMNMSQLRLWTPISFFKHFLPLKFIREHLIPATNRSLMDAGVKGTNVHEFYVWLGIWFLMSLHGQYATDDFFEGGKRERNEFWNPPKCGQYMSRNRFQRIRQCIHLSKSDPPIHRDR
jgi:hypothetical protein